MAYISGGAGNDTIVGTSGSDTLDGGGGRNVVAYSGSPSAVGVQLGRGLTSNDGFLNQDVLINIHGVFGSAHNDIILGSDRSDLLAGLHGHDTIEGLGGDDALNGYAGNDRISGGTGSDTAYFGGNRSDYTVTAINGGFEVTHNSTFADWDGSRVNEGTDIVTEVEFFEFAGGVRYSAVNVTDPNATPEEPGNGGGGGGNGGGSGGGGRAAAAVGAAVGAASRHPFTAPPATTP